MEKNVFCYTPGIPGRDPIVYISTEADERTHSWLAERHEYSLKSFDGHTVRAYDVSWEHIAITAHYLRAMGMVFIPRPWVKE